MIKKLILIGTLAVILSALSLTKSAYAHFIVQDTHTGVKALFHVSPDDDPIAGQESVISFDFSKTGLESKDYTYLLTVKSTKGDAVTVSSDIASNVLLANYTFPSQGFYNISLTLTNKKSGSLSKLPYGQRVSRGVVIEEDSQTLSPVELGAIGGTLLVAVSAIVIVLRSDMINRKEKNETKNHT